MTTLADLIRKGRAENPNLKPGTNVLLYRPGMVEGGKISDILNPECACALGFALLGATTSKSELVETIETGWVRRKLGVTREQFDLIGWTNDHKGLEAAIAVAEEIEVHVDPR